MIQVQVPMKKQRMKTNAVSVTGSSPEKSPTVSHWCSPNGPSVVQQIVFTVST
ncbi:hypothetical protein DPMN_105184 [Dreissena polymorpha]|uniref:Uncharacterized protein n=1 Tax=Dreissena polymorpha TaxID=45954 RepID=A0A9D4HBW2_DREPO|nr:hypothetical protein DPMN_105184 [Dreissena polymorpha]